MAELFGFRFEKLKDVGGEKFTLPAADDGTVEVAGGGFYGQVLDTDGSDRTEQDLVRRYRDIAQQPECDSAIEDIVNEGIVSNEMDQAVQIVLDGIPYPKRIKDKIRDEFNEVLRLLDFDILRIELEHNTDGTLAEREWPHRYVWVYKRKSIK